MLATGISVLGYWIALAFAVPCVITLVRLATGAIAEHRQLAGAGAAILGAIALAAVLLSSWLIAETPFLR